MPRGRGSHGWEAGAGARGGARAGLGRGSGRGLGAGLRAGLRAGSGEATPPPRPADWPRPPRAQRGGLSGVAGWRVLPQAELPWPLRRPQCLAAGSIIMNRELESMAMRPLAKG